MNYTDKGSVVISYFVLWNQQPCMFGRYIHAYVWTDQDIQGVNDQLYAQLVGWA